MVRDGDDVVSNVGDVVRGVDDIGSNGDEVVRAGMFMVW